MHSIFNSASVLVGGMIFVSAYLMLYGIQKRLHKVKFAQFVTMFILPLSIISSVELIYRTMMLLDENLIERDKIVTVLGAFTLLFVSFNSLVTILIISKPDPVTKE